MNLIVVDKNNTKHCYYGIENLNISATSISFDYFLGHTVLTRKFFTIRGLFLYDFRLY